MAAVLQSVRSSLDGAFLVVAQQGEHYLTCSEDGLANALFVARKLARDGWAVRIRGEEEMNQQHAYSFAAYRP
jgi:hypothetical protein